MLLYLAVEGRVHLRKTLSELFWPEGDAMHGRAALRISLLHLRHLLAEGEGNVSHLLIQRDTLGLDLTSAVELDLHILHQAWRLARTSTPTALTMPEDARRRLLAQLQHASSLPRGQFLEGFSLRDAPAFDDWVRLQREYWHLRTSEVFDRLSHLQFEAGELAPALETVSRWLVLAPLQEEAYRRLMRLHFASGDRAAALRAYDTCRAMLATSMQTEPTPETVALASRMRAVAPPRRQEVITRPAGLSPAALLDSPLLGRTAELSTLIKLYHSAQRGHTQVVLLEGEVGIGKTRLASEFLAWAETEGAEVLQGRAFETGGQLPYRPLIEALRPRIERENAPDDLLSDTWLAEWRTALERALPLTRLPLGPLASADILRLLQALGGQEGRPAADLERFGQWLCAETEGQPFYLMETLKFLIERDVLASHPNEEGGWSIDFTAALEHETVGAGFFPPSVREVIVARLDRLTPHAFALLAAGAVLDQGITFAHLCRVAGLEEREGLPALDEALHSQLLQEPEREGGRRGRVAGGRYEFAHAMIRAVIYAEAGEARRSIFHRRALEVLQEAAAPAAVLAYHALAAGLAEPAFHWSVAAGDEAMRVVAVRDAIAFYEQARHLVTERSHGLGPLTVPAAEIEHLYTYLGRAYELNAEPEKARAVYSYQKSRQ